MLKVTFYQISVLDLTTKKNIGVGEVAEATNGREEPARSLQQHNSANIAYGKFGKATGSEIVTAA